MRAVDLTTITWRKSSYSNEDGGECLEVADHLPHVPVRDSKNPTGPTLVFGAEAWAVFVDGVRCPAGGR
ncbi:DUF397 domain-containing protein [Streptomyces tanashiensis]|uniref:DUF397 domain-containing protein n=1 Tax=Streptomyces tanashiensis TaxID=67367 RepID=A0ABY6R2A5_9ACTN|nr:DUF397 domain-containing protein [Streptomyces tanashiensis]UZX23581.1 DUF397 domain-containing protein [Streptomyces tanashiensis]